MYKIGRWMLRPEWIFIFHLILLQGLSGAPSQNVSDTNGGKKTSVQSVSVSEDVIIDTDNQEAFYPVAADESLDDEEEDDNGTQQEPVAVYRSKPLGVVVESEDKDTSQNTEGRNQVEMRNKVSSVIETKTTSDETYDDSDGLEEELYTLHEARRALEVLEAELNKNRRRLSSGQSKTYAALEVLNSLASTLNDEIEQALKVANCLKSIEGLEPKEAITTMPSKPKSKIHRIHKILEAKKVDIEESSEEKKKMEKKLRNKKHAHRSKKD